MRCGARCSPSPHDPRADSLLSLGAQVCVQALLVKPILFLSKVPMVYGTVISNAIFLGAIVSVSAMLSSSGPSPSSTAPPPPGPLSIPGGAPLLQGQGAHCQLPGDPLREVNALLMGLVLHVDRGACCKACTVRCLFREKSPLFITPIFRCLSPLVMSL